MSTSLDKIRQLESDFLSGMEGNLDQARGQLLRGSVWKTTRHDETDRVRSLMAQHRKFDRRLLSDLPKNRRTVLHAFRRRWWFFGKRRVGVAMASVLSPLDWHVEHGESALAGPPIGSRELLDHVRSLLVDPGVPHVIGVCSPTGFTSDARDARSELANVTLVLIEPGDGGGWRVHGGEDVDERLLELFDPEGLGDKHERVSAFLEQHSAELLTGGFSATQVAERMDLPQEVVERAFDHVAEQDPELHSSRQTGELLLYRGAAVEPKETSSMSMVDRIRALFGREGDEAEKINELSRRRAALTQRRDRLYDGIIQLEKREADLLEQGRQNKSSVVRRRIAAQLAQLRKDIQRQNATTAMLNKQIDILSTDIHNLTLIQQGQMADLPSTEILTENAVQAEEMLETLQADAELVSSLETGMADALTSDEELAILKEFDEAGPEAAAAPEQQRTAEPPSAVPDATQEAAADRTDEEPRREPEAS